MRAETTIRSAGLDYCGKSLEGKNFQVIVEEAAGADYDLLVLGAFGLGKVKSTLLGSVCHRVAKHSDKDALFIKNPGGLSGGGEVLVAVDGSEHSFAGLKKALQIAYRLEMDVCAVSVYDPQFHYTVFNSLVEILSQDAKNIFPMEHQERLHTVVIDQGLKNVAQGYLEQAKKMGAQLGMQVETLLLEGKPFDALLGLMSQRKPALLVTGRHGTHRSEMSDIGSNTENLLLLSEVNHLVVGDTTGQLPL
jgi:nucleotide-binding universal stress UspA family protein